MIELEKKIDTIYNELEIWKEDFQSILSSLFYIAESIDRDKKNDTASDYISRISYVFNSIINKSQKSELYSTSDSLTKLNFEKNLDDLNFINAYAHFSMLMPQVHRNIFQVEKINEKNINLKYKKGEILNAEIIDRLFSALAQDVSFSYVNENELKKYLATKIANKQFNLINDDFKWIEDIFQYNLNTQILNEVLTNDVIEKKLGFNYNQYNAFCASLKAYSLFFILLSRELHKLALHVTDHAEKELLISESLEWSVCNLKPDIILKWFKVTAGLNDEEFYNIINFYIIIDDVENEENKLIQKSRFGDGYFPPFLLYRNSIIFSNLAIRYMLPFNNILYSINYTDKAIFDNHISNNLEPTLIEQTIKLFSNFENIIFKKNVNIPGGEIDLIVLDKLNSHCLIFQIKATISASSTRMVRNNESRVLEGFEQIERFNKIDNEEKIKIINNTFDENFENITFENILLIRSSAGSQKAWSNRHKIINYNLLAWILATKKEKQEKSFMNFEKSIDEAIDILLEKAESKVIYEELLIGDYKITFPNIEFNDTNIQLLNLKTHCKFKDFNKV